MIVSIPLGLNPIYLGLKTITIQYCDIQSALDVIQKYRFYKDYTNLFWTLMLVVGILETNLREFLTFPLPKLASFCDIVEMLTYYIDMDP